MPDNIPEEFKLTQEVTYTCFVCGEPFTRTLMKCAKPSRCKMCDGCRRRIFGEKHKRPSQRGDGPDWKKAASGERNSDG